MLEAWHSFNIFALLFLLVLAICMKIRDLYPVAKAYFLWYKYKYHIRVNHTSISNKDVEKFLQESAEFTFWSDDPKNSFNRVVEKNKELKKEAAYAQSQHEYYKDLEEQTASIYRRMYQDYKNLLDKLKKRGLDDLVDDIENGVYFNDVEMEFHQYLHREKEKRMRFWDKELRKEVRMKHRLSWDSLGETF